MPSSHLNDQFDLYLVSNFFSELACRELIDEMRNSEASLAVTYGRESSGVVDERVRRVSQVLLSAKSLELVTERLMDQRGNLAEHFGLDLSGCEEPQFLRYGPGDFFVAHQDGNTGLVRLESDRRRRVSVSIFLNDQTEAPADNCYGGGTLVLSDWRRRLRLPLAESAGTLVAFRSETTHEVIPITHGERFSIVAWFAGA